MCCRAGFPALYDLSGSPPGRVAWARAFGRLSKLCKLSPRKNELKEAYAHNLWDGARKTVATAWDGHAAIWHGYEVHGLEKIPQEGPALIIFYHGAIPIDYYYFVAKVFTQKGRICRTVADHFLFKVPGFSLLLEVFGVLHGPREKCVEILKSGHLLAISPGGVREALFSDETYNIVWGDRKGFAQVAIDAEVPIIPMFTQNVREGFRSLGGTSKECSPGTNR
uniref:Transmembrane protein 68 n=1 Tax=Ornithorhynchus anatinus TaxID=9258 RepID=A0A6I8NQU4_ORNAN